MPRSRSKKLPWLPRWDALPPMPPMILCLSQEEFDAAVDDLGERREAWLVKGCGGGTHFFYDDNTGALSCVVCLDATRPGLEYEQIAALLVHEAVHVAQSYFEDVVCERNPSREMEAYTIQTVSQRLLTAYREQRHA